MQSQSNRDRLLIELLAAAAVGGGLMWRFGVLSLPEVASFFLAILAIIFASIQFREAHQHSLKMELIATSMSTRYIGCFPKDLDDIVQIVSAADQTLLILTDFVDYGRYSKPEVFDRYVEAMTKALEHKVKVRFLVYSDQPEDMQLGVQFSKKQFQEIQSTAEFERFFQKYSGITRPSTHEGFIRILKDQQHALNNDLQNLGAEIGFLDEKALLFFWLEDDEDAVFSFQNIGPHKQDLAFRTRDAKLIETFKYIFEQNWPEPREVAKPRGASSTH